MFWVILVLLAPAAAVLLGAALLLRELWARAHSGDTAALREAVQRRFYPRMEAQGYRRESSGLASVFRREAGARLQVVELRWDKYRRACFHLSFGETPNAPLQTPQGPVPAGAALPAHSRTLGFLGRGARMGLFGQGDWFQLRKPPRARPRGGGRLYSADAVVDQLLEYFPEVEQWFATRRAGPHVRIVRTGE